MGPVFAVMGREQVENTLKVCLVQNEQPVETLRADGAHEPLRHPVGLRCAKGCTHDLDPVTSEYVVKSVGKFLVPIAN